MRSVKTWVWMLAIVKVLTIPSNFNFWYDQWSLFSCHLYAWLHFFVFCGSKTYLSLALCVYSPQSKQVNSGTRTSSDNPGAGSQWVFKMAWLPSWLGMLPFGRVFWNVGGGNSTCQDTASLFGIQLAWKMRGLLALAALQCPLIWPRWKYIGREGGMLWEYGRTWTCWGCPRLCTSAGISRLPPGDAHRVHRPEFSPAVAQIDWFPDDFGGTPIQWWADHGNERSVQPFILYALQQLFVKLQGIKTVSPFSSIWT